MRGILIDAGLRPEHYLIDVGCGSGRLTAALRSYLTGPYLGLDVVPELLAYARETFGRPGWRFEEVQGMVIPERADTADMVCFFSVLTHLMHEDGFRYLLEARRVLKPGGTIVFSFLDFAIESHWAVFSGMLDARNRNESTHHNQFIGRDAVVVWASRLEMEVVAIRDGNATQVYLDNDVVLDDGRVLSREASLGQSICVLRKPALTNSGAVSRQPPAASAAPPGDYLQLQDGLHRSAVRITQLEARLAESEQRMARVANDVQTIARTRSWRLLHAVAAALRAPFASRKG
jgi:SAM-dependent methyltransferase